MKSVSQKVITPLSHKDYNSGSMSTAKKFRSEISQLWTKEGADKIFQNREDFVKWLDSPNPGLSGTAPIQYITSDIQKISDLLGRILHGILA
ncbi:MULTISPECIES: MbcA/ParS/Xre antitoxin family protein [Dyadobacter]|uniref:MbcA/ParS/Xre antitoxin family protein n=1 Tax=Dyadobacter chenhuakuii TaxID=2909339 RepID=A0A9X1QIJ6_9BACT|nr:MULTISPECIES: MbcA/ParS/Xre antitoxin family protein [Dyadobacter]MCE7072214.1 MbcA/ParS/Xre antitoxin family protein [Dyadobacter sp. CY327]MCF2501666.1 MbcA/ParS/Xre antitoxin family protein [Dyadobacter chenhuakuii]